MESTPSFESEWIAMVANSSKSGKTIPHGLGELPLLVKVEAKTTDGWIFPGFGSAQTDDDDGSLYGGVVFIYDDKNINIAVPKWNNYIRNTTWTALYTGNREKWIGPAQIGRTYISVLVRAKAWRSLDFPTASFESEALSVEKGQCVNTTVQHSMGKYPDLVLVQIQTPVGTFQGQGLSSRPMASTASHIGGLLFGFNHTHVQLWSACNISGKLKGLGLLCVADGWGGGRFLSDTGSIIIKTWDLGTSIERFQISDLETKDYILPYQYTRTLSPILSAQIEVKDGPNKNYRFDGVGSVMTEFVPYGGLVYGYSETSVAFWVPHLNKRKINEAAIFMMGEMWGWGYKEQMTNNVDIIISVHNAKVPICIYRPETNIKVSVIKKYNNYNESIYARGDEIHLQCMMGYRYLAGNTTLTCTEAGDWNGEILTCEVITCPETNISYAEILYQNFSIGGLVKYKCIPGSRHKEGNLNRTCTDEGEWNEDPPVCEKCKCPCGMVGSKPIKEHEIEKLHQRLKELKSNLVVLKNTTSRAIRKRISATDVRPSAMGAGAILGVGILLVVIGSIIISDLPKVWSFLFPRKEI
ncbi:uncharacterized protein LOC133196990 [Saccostrea echinata]|uniref:uncharacterized protein LOC133196990 n=1 Tax=Saccostrea echinata TaxID=191078 RepID=UPI002A7EE5B3|nr:uncharacterized protein LOC133196990 [Saccostrea echinata]